MALVRVGKATPQSQPPARRFRRDLGGKPLFEGVARHVYRSRDGLVLDMQIEDH